MRWCGCLGRAEDAENVKGTAVALVTWMDVVLKREESWESGQDGCSKVGRTTMCVGLSHPHALGKSQVADEYASHFGHLWRIPDMPL